MVELSHRVDGAISTEEAASAGSTLAAIAGLAAAWVAAGSTGLLAHPLRHVLTWLLLGAAVVAGWPVKRPSWGRVLALAAAAAVAVIMTASAQPVVNVLAVSLFLAVLAVSGPGRHRLLLASVSAAVLGVYRLAYTSIPMVWLAGDSLGELLGRLAGSISGRPLWVGATFGGVDCLVMMAAFHVAWLLGSPCPRWLRAAGGALAILIGHLLYLIAISFAPEVLAALPVVPHDPSALPSVDAARVWSWPDAVRSLVPWSLPALAVPIQLLIAAGLLSLKARPAASDLSSAHPWRVRNWLVPAALSLLLPVATTLSWTSLELKGKKVVVHEKGFLNWLKPTHGDYGRLSIGMYGMLPGYLESLGATCVVSPELSEDDIRGADLVVLIFPNQPWTGDQLERLWRFVREGGSLLVLGEHTTREEDGGNRFDEVLAPTAMRVAFDSATFAIGGWLHSYECIAHPAAAGIPDDRNQFGVVIGASLDVHWPARPVLVGRWGWADPGDEKRVEQAQMGNHQYDPGERLGDLVLAAEQPLGKGKVMAFGDTSGLTNGITTVSHLFTSRLYAYLVGSSSSPQATWRGVVGLLAALGLVVLLSRRPVAWNIALVSLVLSASLCLCVRISYRAAELLPDGRRSSPPDLAYIDLTHLGNFSGETWREDGLGGLELTLMRNGYLTLSLTEFDLERIQRADLLISVAPVRAFTAAERNAVHQFVEGGGVFVLIAGQDERKPSEALLADFGFYIGSDPSGADGILNRPLPMGHFKSPYVNTGEYMAHVRFHAAWPVGSTSEGAQVIAYGRGDLPVIMVRRVGRGNFALIGDTSFAANKNLENEGGEPFEGLRENAHFWRWFLTYLTDKPFWIPPRPKPEAPPGSAPSEEAAGGGTESEPQAGTAADAPANDEGPGPGEPAGAGEEGSTEAPPGEANPGDAVPPSAERGAADSRENGTP